MGKKIIQISDVHFGDSTFSDGLKSNLLTQLEDGNPDLLIFAGDLTASGHAHEYEQALEFVDELKSITKTHIVPGNHDARNVGLVHFENMISERKFVHTDKAPISPSLDLIHLKLMLATGRLDMISWTG